MHRRSIPSLVMIKPSPGWSTSSASVYSCGSALISSSTDLCVAHRGPDDKPRRAVNSTAEVVASPLAFNFD
jgi:hypothetical protein